MSRAGNRKSGGVVKSPPQFRMSNDHRVKIQNSNILNALIEHVEGSREMTPSQVTAGLGLLKKVMPDLQSNQHSGPGGGPITTLDLTHATDEQIAALEAFIAPAAILSGGDTGSDQS